MPKLITILLLSFIYGSTFAQSIAKAEETADIFFARGQALDERGLLQQAIGAYAKCLQLDETFIKAWFYKGNDLYNISRYADALKDLNRFIYKENGYGPAYNVRGLANLKLGNTDSAIADFSSYIALSPANSFAYSNRGTVYLNYRQYTLAKTDLEKAISLNDKNADAYYGLAQVYNGTKSFTAALPLAEKAIALNTDIPAYYAAYASALIGLNRDKEAIPVADKIIALDKNNADGWLIKAVAYSNTNDFSSGITTLTAGIATIPGNYLLYSMRASIYRFQHNEAAALADDAKAKELATQ